MKTKLLFIILFIILFNFSAFTADSDDVFYDPRDITVMPKAKNGLFLFKIKYKQRDFLFLVKRAMEEGTADKQFKSMGLNKDNIISYYNMLKSMSMAAESKIVIQTQMTATVRNLDTNQTFNVILHPVFKRAVIPNVTIGKYKFEKLNLLVITNFCSSSLRYLRNDIMIDSELPEFSINSNTAVIYGLVDLRNGEIIHSNDEITMEKLRKYVDYMKQFQRYANIKVIEMNTQNASVTNSTGEEGEK